MAVTFIVPARLWRAELEGIAVRALRALGAAQRAGPGDRDDAMHFGGLLREIELIVRRMAVEGRCEEVMVPYSVVEEAGTQAVPWTDEYRRAVETWYGTPLDRFVVFVVAAPERQHASHPSLTAVPAAGPARVWRAPPGAKGRSAEEARWKQQLRWAVDESDQLVALVPSGIHNRTLTEGLREFVEADSGPRRDARVVYRDGSEARRFPLRAMQLSEEVPPEWPVVRVALMSLRHPEMDCDIDAALLRNRDISVARPTAETDEHAYSLSLAQLKAIAACGPRVIHLYQVGLEPAIIGFYRAVTDLLVDGVTPIVVVPMFHERKSYAPGKPWCRA